MASTNTKNIVAAICDLPSLRPPRPSPDIARAANMLAAGLRISETDWEHMGALRSAVLDDDVWTALVESRRRLRPTEQAQAVLAELSMPERETLQHMAPCWNDPRDDVREACESLVRRGCMERRGERRFVASDLGEEILRLLAENDVAANRVVLRR